MKNKKYNLAVIGGGPAGMMAAGRAAELGSSVVLIEKNDRLGVKLAITGKGRCNITNAEESLKKLIEVFGVNGKFLYSAFNKLSNNDVVDFFESRGVATKVERGNRVFPVSDSSMDVIDCLNNYLREGDVEVRYNSSVREFKFENKQIMKVVLENGDKISADKFVIATGGKSYPGTGSTGEAYSWLEKMGHTIVEPQPMLTPILVKEGFVKELEGLSLKNVEVSLWDKKKIASEFGEALFTGNGLSGPIVLNLSRVISEKKLKNVKIKIDFKPALDYPTLDKRILKDFEENKKKQFKNSLDKLMPQKMIPVVIKLSGIDEEKKICDISKEERKLLVKLLKEFEVTYKSLVGFDKAIVTAGGVDLKEVDPRTMKSKVIDNLCIVGEVLDVDGPTGGYNLQVAWSTGFLCGDSI